MQDLTPATGARCRLELLGEASLALDDRQPSLLGLQWSEGHFATDPVFFPCCGGTGQNVLSDGSVRMCGARERIVRLDELERTFRRIWGSEPAFPPMPLVGDARRLVVETLDGFAVRRDPRGAVWPCWQYGDSGSRFMLCPPDDRHWPT